MSTTQEDEWFETLESFRFYYPRYLQSKTSVDKKAFHKETWNHFSTLLGSFSKEEIRLIDVGAGIGSMFLHLLEEHLFDKFPSVEYILVDANSENVLFGIQWLVKEVQQKFPHYSISYDTKVGEILSNGAFHSMEVIELLNVEAKNSIHFHRGSSEAFAERNWLELQFSWNQQQISLKFYFDDVMHFSQADHFRGYFDVVIAAAFLDLYDCSMMIETLFSLLQHSGIFYFPINYDGEMYFSPKHSDHSLEARILRTYHALMDGLESSEQSHHSESGKEVVLICKERADDIQYGESWWNVSAEDPKSKYFLLCILKFVQDSTQTLLKGPLPDSYFHLRKQQLNHNMLNYSARNIDCCGKIHFSS